jgi:hypothetical protein
MQANDYRMTPVMEIYDKPNRKIFYVVPYTLGPYTFENLLSPSS